MIYKGDLFDVLPTLPADSVDSCVTDPPYELGFMGKRWDSTGIANNPETWKAVYRVLKPGAHLAAFSSSRTHHRMMCAIEDAGFEIRDCLMWLYGQGFPKSLDISKAIDKAAGAKRTEKIGPFYNVPNAKAVNPHFIQIADQREGNAPKEIEYSATMPVTAAAAQWQGWGTALKPAYEPIILARKPFDNTVAANVQKYGTGALNIDGCRLEARGQQQQGDYDGQSAVNIVGSREGGKTYGADLGRWPANVILDEEAAALLDEQSGALGASTGVAGGGDIRDQAYGKSSFDQRMAHDGFGDFGGASRFFYTAKPSRSERDEGLDSFARKSVGELTDRDDDSAGAKHARAGAGHGGGRNVHPTVKPIALMHWLVTLITPPGGTVLDPFCGSGTTGMGARWANCIFIGVEKEAEYAAIAERRISATNPLFHDEETTTPIAPQQAENLFAPLPSTIVQPESLFTDPVADLASSLRSRGHRLLTRDGKLFLSNANQLTDADRAAIKAHKPALLARAEPWPETSPSSPAAPTASRGPELAASGSALAFALQPSPSPAVAVPRVEVRATLAEFLGTPAAVDYVPDTPPDLTGIDEVILNFATTGLRWRDGDHPCGLTVSTLDGRLTRFLPFGFAGGNLDEAAVKRWAQEQLRDKRILNAKTKFDIHHAREWGVDLEAQGCTFSDIQHTAALLDDHRKRFGLDVLAKDYFPNDPFVGRVDETRHHEHHAAEVAERELFTARLVGRLRDVMYPELDKQELREVQKIEDDVIQAVVEMERNGSPIDMALLEQYGRECSEKHDALMWEIAREVGFAFEHTAKGWAKLLDHLHLPGLDSYAEAELSAVDHPLVRKGQRAAQFASLNSKIFKAYPEHIVDGVLRYDINQLASDEGGTVSGRFSIGLVQQVPNADNHEAAFGDWGFPRRLFIPGSGSYLEADAAQIEFRLLVHYSQNVKLLQAYADDPQMSFHKKMQELLQAYKPDMLYAHTKNYNFAAQYGARSIKLAVMMRFITEKEGTEIRAAKRWNDPRLNLIHEIEAAYKRAHPEAGALLDRAAHLAKSSCDDFCKKGDALHRQFPHRGYVKTLDGRRRRFPTNYKTYAALNGVLQGTAASLMKKKLTELHNERAETGFIMRITNHDAALGDATAPETLSKVNEILNRQSFPLKVPILWKCGTGPNWAEAK